MHILFQKEYQHMYNNYLIISYSMKKLIFLLFIIISTSAFTQKMEHGILIGVGLGIPMQDCKQLIPSTNTDALMCWSISTKEQPMDAKDTFPT